MQFDVMENHRLWSQIDTILIPGPTSHVSVALNNVLYLGFIWSGNDIAILGFIRETNEIHYVTVPTVTSGT